MITLPKPQFDKDEWVVQTKGRFRGRVGRLAEHPIYLDANDGSQIGRALVQFGADGPFAKLQFKSLRRANSNEIPRGVG